MKEAAYYRKTAQGGQRLAWRATNAKWGWGDEIYE